MSINSGLQIRRRSNLRKRYALLDKTAENDPQLSIADQSINNASQDLGSNFEILSKK
jgi:hypothetical protein